MQDVKTLFRKCDANPLLRATDFADACRLIASNPVQIDGEVAIMLSFVPYGAQAPVQTYVARSADGASFELADSPFVVPADLPAPFCHAKDYQNCQIAQVDGTYLIVSQAVVNRKQAAVLFRSPDLQSFEPISILPVSSQTRACVVPGRIDGKVHLLWSDSAEVTDHWGTLWTASSEDLKAWGDARPVMHNGNIATAVPSTPVRTDKGWLMANYQSSQPCDGWRTYSSGLLLGLDAPGTVVATTPGYFFRVTEVYEWAGIDGNVCPPCGFLIDEQADTIDLYYTGAGISLCRATGPLSTLLERCNGAN